MDILFIYPHIGDGSKREPDFKRYFPWGVATVMRFLEDDGHKISLLDIYGDDLLFDEVEDRLKNKTYDYACISSFASYNFSYVLKLARTVKRLRQNVPVIVGGILADLHHELLLAKPEVDICVLGEGEITAVELFRNIDDPSNVPGIAFEKNGEIVKTPARELIKDLDTLPLPNFSLWNMDRYLRGSLWADDLTTRYDEYPGDLPSRSQLTPNLAVFFSRGCPFQCRFCSRSYRGVRFKSPDKVVKELQALKDEFGIKAFHFYDELVVFNRKTVLELCEKIKPLNVYWDCYGRVNTVDEELMRVLKESNCFSLGFGFESGSTRILKAMGKRTTREDNLRILEAAKRVGMHLKIQLMCGYPGETEESIAETVSMMKISELPPRGMVHWTTPLPGSELYADALDQGLIGDEEEYLVRLGELIMNSPDRILLNVSGLPDKEMIRLSHKINSDMWRNYLVQQMRGRSPFSGEFWYFVFRLTRNALGRIAPLRSFYYGLERWRSGDH